MLTPLCAPRCSSLAAAVRDEAQAWVRGIAGVMAEADAAQLEALRQQVMQLGCGWAGVRNGAGQVANHLEQSALFGQASKHSLPLHRIR